MLTVGIIGGMSWASSKEYYQIINETIERSTSNKQGAHILLDSLDFSLIDRLQHEKSWDQLRDIMISSANKLKYLGADLLLSQRIRCIDLQMISNSRWVFEFYISLMWLLVRWFHENWRQLLS